MLLRTFLLLATTTLALSTTSGAQSRSGKVFARYDKPLESVSLDLATGTVTRGAAVRDRTITTVVDFFNNDLAGFVGIDTGNGFCEWFDAGVKGFNGVASDCMSNIVFAYCTSMLTPGSGGPGGSVKLGFYEGYLVGGGAPTTMVAVFTVSGLPGNSASSSFVGGFSCYFAEVQFGSLIGFSDGPIGYSWGFLGVGATGVLAGTWPFLACVVSCSGAIGQVDGQGMTDALDQYCPPGTLRSTFTFGTTSGSFTSFSMEIREAIATPSITAYNATTTPNPDTLIAGTPVLGSSWSGLVTRPSGASMTAAVVNVRTARIPLANGVQGPAPLPLGAGGRILISGPRLTYLFGAHDGMVGSVGSVVPASFDLVCLHFAAQATVVGGGVRLSSAVEGTTGTF
jgi:hypothetical protein